MPTHSIKGHPNSLIRSVTPIRPANASVLPSIVVPNTVRRHRGTEDLRTASGNLRIEAR